MKDNFDACLDATLTWEGGYSNHHLDPGGATNRGVTTARYNEYRDDKGLSRRHVKNLTQKELEEIYRVYYWDIVKGDLLPAGVDLAVFDYAVNSGPSRSIKHLQGILGVDVDGVLGNETLKAVGLIPPRNLVKAIMDRRQRFVRGLKSLYKTFGRGWENRIRDIRAVATSMTTEPFTRTNKTNIIEDIIKWFLSFLKF